MAPRWSFVIPAYNEQEILPTTLVSLRRNLAVLPGDSEIVVVDNNSTDRTGAIARAAGVRVVEEPVNNIARARNAGGRVARGEILVFLDADSLVGPELLRDLAVEMADPNCMAGSAAQVPDRKIPASDAAGMKVWNALAAVCGLFSGHFLTIRRPLWRELGGFPEWLYALDSSYFSRGVTRWCRRHGCRTFNMRHPRLPFNCRKIVHQTWLTQMKLMPVWLLGPLVTRWRWFCSFWYDRPWQPPK